MHAQRMKTIKYKICQSAHTHTHTQSYSSHRDIDVIAIHVFVTWNEDEREREIISHSFVFCRKLPMNVIAMTFLGKFYRILFILLFCYKHIDIHIHMLDCHRRERERERKRKKMLQHVCYCGYDGFTKTPNQQWHEKKIIGISPFIRISKRKWLFSFTAAQSRYVCMCVFDVVQVLEVKEKKELCGIAKETYCIQISIAFCIRYMVLDSIFLSLYDVCMYVFVKSTCFHNFPENVIHSITKRGEIRWKILHPVKVFWCECVCVCAQISHTNEMM